MSRIRRLSIRGIRNFGDDNEEATIRFYRPLTLILGPNGTGKTTIIEALKYATCGEFPPNSDRGKCFIHDPTLSMTSSVRGIVKAEIVDRLGNVLTICRAIESSKTNVTYKFKTLDSALSRKNKDTKEVVSITNRCADVDTELTLAMGVSKPILDYVIFCHQEDFSWPFQDGKKLKEKFDEIFDSANFNRALESILKHVKELQTHVKVLNEQRNSCQLLVSQVEDKEKRLKDTERRLENAKEKIEEINKELQPIIQRVRNLEKIDTKYKNLQIEEKNKRAEYDLSKQQLQRLKDNIGEIFEGSLPELLAEIESYDEKLKGKVEEIKEFETRITDITQEETEISNLLANERVASGSLQQQVKDQERKLRERNKILNQTLSAFGLDTVDSNVSDIEVLVQKKRLQEKMLELEQLVEDNKKKREEEEKELEKEVDILRTEYSKTESEKKLKENEVIEARSEINKIKSEITQLGVTTKLNFIEAKIETVKTKIQQLNEKMNIDAAREEVTAKTKLRDETEANLNAVDEEIALLLKENSLQAELELHKKTLQSQKKELQTLKEKHEEAIKDIFDMKEVTEIKLKHKLDEIEKELVNQIEDIQQQVKTEECQFTTLETTIKHTERDIQKMKKEIETDKEKVSSVCNYKDFDESVLLQSKKLKDLQDKRGIYAHQGVAYKEYMKQLKKTDPCCPLCHRGFQERQAVENLLKEMENEMENHPNRLKDCEKELKMQQEKYDKMLQLKPVVEKIIHFEEDELDKSMDNLDKMRAKLAKSQTCMTELKEKKSKPEKRLMLIQNIVNDIILWDMFIDRLSEVKQTIDSFQTRMHDAGIKSERSIEEAQNEREKLKISLKSIRDDIENLQSSINSQNEKVHNAREELNALLEEQFKVRSNIQKLNQLKEKQENLFSKEISLGKSVEALRQKSTTAECNLNSALEKLEKKRKENRDNHEIDRNRVAQGTRRLSELEKADNDLSAFVFRKLPEELERSEMKIKNYETSINNLQREKNTTETTINKLKEEITRQEVRKRDLSDNILLRKTHETTKVLQQQCSNLRNELMAINYTQVMEEWKNLQNREEALSRQKNMAKGNQEELERTIQLYNEELKKDMYRQARKQYKSKSIELTVTEETIANLKTYSKALDRAMIEYHEERMTTVNRIIKKMWKLVYTGTDTTSIEIRTDITGGIGGAKRTYNYKLVQTKHGHDIDMKGRCSAGQRVLASIIIRLALAETFCKDCGILALDEPTTNLDQENADSLANALATVVKLRSQHQKNFQLIVISHDEKFLFKLAELNNNKMFYQLYRKNNGYSAIGRCEVENPNHFEADDIKEEVSSEDEANEYSSNSRNKLETDSYGKGDSGHLQQRKRHHRGDSDSEDHTETRPSKLRYVLNM
ncbi:DNA repair protein rad50 [Nomia melanderi]|uniref:DNA repair protein rad50 n=1 Tax=Nomia melanderi TaxID=2448451 RepID=UPI001304019E|nr:DNA repair protein RAD50 [Nomia melanderi]XP_031845351.1 DNA repair protein RAD50 [Nomia melanderi]XP_031845360.1 DNA repair protein RAD50 [Nomia melanderi]XP_031845370.1 DNA repair protein RAD50 [Nomia melanderi]XP_031845379.1 DNA repair protein RAD50 [Nomia melanderi]XP_031845388.1 DNA repair protein RAD50 [Nomia melanderi]XP_031845398.1 DNA repair protein RAD50 [Nomia melanderi]XP_031845408.1 DNA repair protein RAD50 [Nomia melanderi]XP_031845418.1 DNA repair protein RAD50 [Nomia mela